MMPRRKVAVIGGGPAGLMAADMLSADGTIDVEIHERMPTAGRKLLMAGRGGLNLTHSEPLEAFVRRYGEAETWLTPILAAFPPERLVSWSAELGQPTFIGTSGRVFPRAMKASPLLRAWLARLDARGVRLVTRSSWVGFCPPSGRPTVVTPAGATTLTADAVILALGGASWPRLGSDGAWVAPLRAAGVEIQDLAPANMGVEIAWSPYVARFAGTPIKRIAAALAGPGTDVAAGPVRGEIVISQRGLEGGAIYHVAAVARRLVVSGGAATLVLDLRPDLDVDALAARIAAADRRQSQSSRLRKAAGLTAAATAILREGQPGPILPTDAAALARRIKSVTLPLTGVGDIARAISSAGGVRRSAVDDRLMLRSLPGVFVAGEMLDWEAPTGGYLLQATFATAVAAAGGVRDWLSRPLG